MQARLASGKSLCSCCRAITLEQLLRPEGFSHISQPSLLSSSTKDCRICNLIYSSIVDVISSQAWQPWWDKTGSDRFTILRALKRETHGIDQILVCFGFCTDSSKDDGNQSILPPGTCLVGRLEVFTDKEDPAANFVDYRSITGEPDSERSWFMVDQLVAECTNHHALCRASQVGTLPSRIIELRSGVDDIIFPTVSDGRQGNYTGLSYCWGGPQEIVATKDSWEKLMEGIQLQVLPKTIQDAVVITRRLGHKYLWVDALCILQDSEQDWLSEASKMADIYGNASVTISAAGGSDCNAGCFMKGKANTGQELDQLVLGLPNGDTGIIYLRVNNSYKPANDPLNKRGWALQERLLSPRLLIYSAGKVSWQCQTKSGARGIGSARLPNYFFDNLLTNGYKRKWHSPSPKMDETLFILWAQIALDYSRRDLTYESDALPALSGLARRFQDITSDEYLAGLWRESLCKWLMWHTATYIKSRPLTYLAPTWSWLSLRGPILFVHSRFNSDSSLIKVLDAMTILAGPDTTGPVSAGKITLRGQVKEVQRRRNEIWEVGTGQACKVGLALLDLFAELVDAMEGPLFCLRVSEYNGLLLKPSGVDYQRVGIFISDSNSDGEDVEKYPFKDWEMCTLTLV